MEQKLEWALIAAGFVIGTLLILPSTRPDFLKAQQDATPAIRDETMMTADQPGAMKGLVLTGDRGRLVPNYEIYPPLHPEDEQEMLGYIENLPGTIEPQEARFTIAAKPLRHCMARNGNLINEETVRCSQGFKFKIALVRVPHNR